MKFLLLLSLGVLGAATAFADEKPSFTISASYADLDPAFLADATQDSSGKTQGLSTPRVTTKSGQRATIEIIKEFIVISSTSEPRKMNCGVTLDVEPNFKDGKIILSGKSIVRRRELPTEKQPLNAISFTTRETFFDGEVSDDKPLAIQMGDGVKDTSRVILTAKQVEPSKAVHVSHTGAPKFRVFAIEPSPEEARQPVYMTLGITPIPPAANLATPPASDLSSHSSALVEVAHPTPALEIRGVVDPNMEAVDHAQSTLAMVSAAALKPLTDADAPLTIAGTLSPDGQIVDVHLQAKGDPAKTSSTEVSIYWGGDIFLTVADATRPTGRRGLLVRQE